MLLRCLYRLLNDVVGWLFIPCVSYFGNYSMVCFHSALYVFSHHHSNKMCAQLDFFSSSEIDVSFPPRSIPAWMEKSATLNGEICYSGDSALKHKITLHKTTENSELHSCVCNKTHTKNQCNFQWVVAHLWGCTCMRYLHQNNDFLVPKAGGLVV